MLGINAIYATENKVFESPTVLNNYGMPGTIDNPTAEAFPEGQFSVSTSVFGGTIRTNLSFQISDSLTASFRYSRIPTLEGDFKGYTWDRSFDVHYLVKKQSHFFPSIAIGLRDFIGTGLYSGEYLVATKNISSRLKITAGIGWGRLSGKNNFSNIFGQTNRTSRSGGFGGTLSINQFFSGKNSPFFGLEYKLNEKTQFVAEFSSDDYDKEALSPKGFDRENDLNIGIKYQLAPDLSIMGSLMHGNAIGLKGILAVNPRNSPHISGIEPAPMPLMDESSVRKIQSYMDKAIFVRSAELLALDGITLLNLAIEDVSINAKIVDRNYRDVSQMVGRVARIIAKTTPLDIKFITIEMIDYQSGYSVSKVTIEREKLREFELAFDGPMKFWEYVKIENSEPGMHPSSNPSDSPLTWSFYPDINIVLFDPHSPINGSIGWVTNLSYKVRNSLTINGSFKQAILTALDDIKRGPKSGLPNVRSDFMYYYRDISTRPYLESLSIDQYYKPSKNIFSQINIGYLEMMYAGIRAEAIWKDVKKPYGFGLDITAVRKRGTFGDFSILDKNYSTFIGTLYYDPYSNWNAKLDVGRYLAGDFGTTVSLSKTFNNGWEIGAFATITDVEFSAFGEGSFDKGIILKAPLTWFTGKKSQAYRETVIKPITGDGGARLDLENDKFLYNNVARYGEKSFKDNWKRVFR